MCCSQLPHQLSGVQTRIVSKNDWNLHESLPKGLHGHTLLSAHLSQLLLNCLGHGHLHGPSAPDNSGFLDGLVQHCQCIMQGSLGLIQDMLRASPEHDGTGFSLGASRKLDDLVFTDHDLFDAFAAPKDRHLRVFEGRRDVSTQHCSKAFATIKVGVLNRHDASFLEELIWVVVDQLSVDEDVALVIHDLLDLLFHLVLLSLFDFCYGLQRIYLDASSIDFDLVRVHLAVRHQNLAVLQNLLVTYTDPLFKDEALLQEGIFQGTASFLEHLDVVQIRLATQPQHCIYRERRKVVFLMLQQFGAQGGSCNTQQVLSELRWILSIVHGQSLELRPCSSQGKAVAPNDDLWMHFLLYESLRVSQHLCSQHHHRGRAITTLLILCLGNVDQNPGSRVVDPHRFQDRRSIVGHRGI
mmetsp:Transcript_2347/g.5543  ORF Transcript_2347/g.5543 Transcript_2347/m.5543 type:complete len:411 (-) Transcript_2347:231-1463(-)